MQLSQQPDAYLIGNYIKGNEKALETLIYRYKDRIYTSIYLLVKDHYLAEDLFQDTFLKIIKTIKNGQYDEQGKFLPYSIRVAHNLCMDYFRKVRRTVSVTLPNGEDIAGILGLTEPASSRMEDAQTQNTLFKLLDKLPEDQREVVIMRIYGDLSFKEIAEATNVSINTSLGRMRYALLNLRKMITAKKLVLR